MSVLKDYANFDQYWATVPGEIWLPNLYLTLILNDPYLSSNLCSKFSSKHLVIKMTHCVL